MCIKPSDPSLEHERIVVKDAAPDRVHRRFMDRFVTQQKAHLLTKAGQYPWLGSFGIPFICPDEPTKDTM